jgi:hypothetical protein
LFPAGKLVTLNFSRLMVVGSPDAGSIIRALGQPFTIVLHRPSGRGWRERKLFWIPANITNVVTLLLALWAAWPVTGARYAAFVAVASSSSSNAVTVTYFGPAVLRVEKAPVSSGDPSSLTWIRLSKLPQRYGQVAELTQGEKNQRQDEDRNAYLMKAVPVPSQGEPVFGRRGRIETGNLVVDGNQAGHCEDDGKRDQRGARVDPGTAGATAKNAFRNA